MDPVQCRLSFSDGIRSIIVVECLTQVLLYKLDPARTDSREHQDPW